jgi:hypothetical protein
LRKGDVTEQDRDTAELGLPDAEREDVIPAIEGAGFLLESHWLAGQRHLSTYLEPVLLVSGGELTHRAADCLVQARLLFEGGVHVEEPVVRPHARLVEQDLDGAEALIEGFEQVSAVIRRGTPGALAPQRSKCYPPAPEQSSDIVR